MMEYSNQDMSRLQQLFQRYYAGNATTEEMNELAGLVTNAGNHDLLPVLKDAWEQEEGEPLFSAAQSNAVFQSIIQHRETKQDKKKVRSITWWLAAAAVTGLLFAGYWFFMPSHNKNIPQQAKQTIPAPQDVSPGKDGAILTLSDGRNIILDNAGNGNIASEGNTNVVKRDGQLQYDLSAEALAKADAPAKAELTNTMSTPRGRQFSVLLADGSKVWLNASSSITFPTAFAGKERRVQITGELYFEVTHDTAKPFRVQLPNGHTVEVLGTKFNINTYADEEAVKTTLLEGKVKVQPANGSTQQPAVLKPGEQAVMQNARLTIHDKINLDEVMAWRNGFFSFNNTDLKIVLRQLSRWYDVDVVYEGKMENIQFSGEMGRSLTLNQVLSILEDTRIHYTIEGKKLLIKP